MDFEFSLTRPLPERSRADRLIKPSAAQVALASWIAELSCYFIDHRGKDSCRTFVAQVNAGSHLARGSVWLSARATAKSELSRGKTSSTPDRVRPANASLFLRRVDGKKSDQLT